MVRPRDSIPEATRNLMALSDAKREVTFWARKIERMSPEGEAYTYALRKLEAAKTELEFQRNRAKGQES